jgi:hypothetical protein
MRALYHFTPQGSRLMPRRWFLALERADNETPFAAPENLARFGFIWSSGAAAARLNPDTAAHWLRRGSLPLSRGNGQWLGLTCAACHSAEVTAHGRRFRVEGAPAALDFDSFGAELNAAVQATLRDAAKFGRLLQRVASAGGRTDGLRASFATYAAASDAHWRMQRPSLASGPGRVDALGQILNSLAATQLGEPANARPPSAPTSYPFLWTTPRQEYVQWAPIASSPIERNAGEVLGVFGHAELTARPWPRELGGGRSTALRLHRALPRSVPNGTVA